MQDSNLARRAMVDNQLRPQGVTDRGVLAAMGKVERERFASGQGVAFAYFDRPLPIGQDRSMMPPAALGRLLSDLAPRAGERALVIGSGTGYSAAVLREIGVEVVALESDAALAEAAATAGVETVVGDLSKGWANAAPFDFILVDGAIEQFPQTLAAQLVPDGRFAGGIAERGVTRLVSGRISNGALALRSVADADVAPLPGFERPRAFTF